MQTLFTKQMDFSNVLLLYLSRPFEFSLKVKVMGSNPLDSIQATFLNLFYFKKEDFFILANSMYSKVGKCPDDEERRNVENFRLHKCGVRQKTRLSQQGALTLP